MRVQLLDEFGEATNFRLAQVPDPIAGPEQVLVKIHASSVNPADYKIRRGGPAIAPALPASLGMDLAGTVSAVGEGVRGFKIGDEVYGCAGGVRGMPGTYAELIATDPALLAPKPKSLTFREAAALPLVTITAWEGLARAGVKVGTNVLIHGGAGGVGHIAIQIAKAWGARVFATVSSNKKGDIARRFGADEVINYREEAVDAYVQRLTDGQGFDVVFDCTGGSDIATSFAAARLNGQVVTIVSQYEADLSFMHAKGLTLHVVFMLIPMLHNRGREEHGRILREATALVDTGKLKPLLDEKRFDLAEVPAAHRNLEEGKAVGKLVIDIGA